MSVLLIGDTQIANHKAMGGPMVGGLNRRCREILEALEYTIGYAREHCDIKAIIQVGDFFDIAKPSPALYTAVIELIKRHPVEWHIMAGNHDIASYDAPTAIAPLAHLANVKIYEKPTAVMIDGALWSLVPYTGPSCEAAIDEAYNVLDGRLPRFWACHYGLVDKTAFPRPDLFNLHYDRPSNNYQCWFFGHEHGSNAHKQGVGRDYQSVGSFCDYDFGDGTKRFHMTYEVRALWKNEQGQQVTDNRGGYNLLDLPTPLFCTIGRGENWDLDVLARQFSHASAMYVRCDPGQVETLELWKQAGLIKDYVIKPADIEISDSSAETPTMSGSYMDCVAEELSTSETDPEQIGSLWELCDKFMQEETR